MKDKELVDSVFDKLYNDGKMSWLSRYMLFGCLVFIAWKDMVKDSVKTWKGHVVIDIWALNKVVIKDLYPLPLQEDFLAKICGKWFILVMDMTLFFY